MQQLQSLLSNQTEEKTGSLSAQFGKTINSLLPRKETEKKPRSRAASGSGSIYERLSNSVSPARSPHRSRSGSFVEQMRDLVPGITATAQPEPINLSHSEPGSMVEQLSAWMSRSRSGSFLEQLTNIQFMETDANKIEDAKKARTEAEWFEQEKSRLDKEEADRKIILQEAERLAKEEAKRKTMKLEAARKAKEDALKKEAERQKMEEAMRRNAMKEEEERKAKKETLERQARREELEKFEKREAETKALKAEAERLAKEYKEKQDSERKKAEEQSEWLSTEIAKLAKKEDERFAIKEKFTEERKKKEVEKNLKRDKKVIEEAEKRSLLPRTETEKKPRSRAASGSSSIYERLSTGVSPVGSPNRSRSGSFVDQMKEIISVVTSAAEPEPTHHLPKNDRKIEADEAEREAKEKAKIIEAKEQQQSGINKEPVRTRTLSDSIYNQFKQILPGDDSTADDKKVPEIKIKLGNDNSRPSSLYPSNESSEVESSGEDSKPQVYYVPTKSSLDPRREENRSRSWSRSRTASVETGEFLNTEDIRRMSKSGFRSRSPSVRSRSSSTYSNR